MLTRPFSILLGLFLYVAAYPLENSTYNVTLHLSVSDNYTGRPLEEARATLYHRGQEVAHAVTGPQGDATLEYTITGLEVPGGLSSDLLAGQNYPNPFDAKTQIPLEVGKPQQVYVRIVNFHGQELAVGSKFLEKGDHTILLSLGHLPPGIYFAGITGIEPHVIRLVKTGRQEGEAGQAVSFIQGSLQTLYQPLPNKSGQPKSAETDYYLRITKERYSPSGVVVDIEQDDGSTFDFQLKRENAVVFKTTDKSGEPVDAVLQVAGEFFNLSVNPPDTLFMHAGTYAVSCEMDFFIPLDEEIEIKASDTSFVFHLEEVGAMLYVQEDPSNDLLFVADHKDGSSVYYHGLRDPGNDAGEGKSFKNSTGASIVYVTITHEDGSYSVVIFNDEYYPIKWITDDYIISVRRTSGEEFDPEKARISFFTNTEDTLTLNIKTGDLKELVNWMEKETGDDFHGIHEFLAEYSDNFEEIRQIALTEECAEGLYNRAAVAFSAAASAKAFSEFAGGTKKSVVAGQVVPKATIPVPPPVPIIGDLWRNLLNSIVSDLLTDRSGITIPIFVCRGSTKWYGFCQETYHLGPAVSPCLARCVAYMDCFVDICKPDVLNIQKALGYKSKY